MTEEERFYHRANIATDVVVYGVLAREMWRQSGPHTPFSSTTKAWGFGALGCVGLWFWSMMAKPESEACRLYHEGCGSWSFWMVLFTVLGCICLLVMMVTHGAECELQKKQQQQRPAAPAAPAAPATPRPTPPPVTQTRVERSVRVVRAPAAATTHHNSQAPVAALQAPHKDVEQSTDLVVVRHRQRPILWTEDHGTYRSVDRRSFDRDIGPV